MRETALQGGFGALRADARVAEVGAAAVGTALRHVHPSAAYVAAQAVVGTVVGVGDGAVGTLRDPVAGRTLKDARIATPI